MRIIFFLALSCLCAGCNRESYYAGKRLDVVVDMEYLYRNRGAIPFKESSYSNDFWIPMPNLGGCNDPRVALVGVGLCLSVGIIVSVSNEIIGIVKTGNTSFGKTVYKRMEMRILCNGVTYVAAIGPGHNRIELTNDMETAMKCKGAIINIYADGNLSVNKSVKFGKIHNPERSLIQFLGDGHVYIDDECVE